MGQIADLMRDAGIHASTAPGANDGGPDVRYEEDIPGDYEDVSGYDPMDFGDEDDVDDGPDDIAEDTTDFAAEYRSGPAVAPPRAPKQTRQQAPQAPPKEEKGNVYAKLRIAERDKRIMEERFTKLLDAISSPSQEQEEQEPEIVPFEQDPLTHLVSKVDAVNRKMDKQNLSQKQIQERQEVAGLLERADYHTNEIVEKIGEDNWLEAMDYLAEVRIEDFLERNPDRTRDEANQIIGAAVLKEKVALTKAGRNAPELYLKDAIRFGYRPAALSQQQAPAAPVGTKQPARTAKQEIRDQNSKGQGTRTLGSLNGAPAKEKLSAKAVVGMSEADFRDLVDEATKEKGRNGQMKLSDFIRPNSN